MKNKILNIMLTGIMLASSSLINVANAGIIPTGGFGVNSNFIDNGIITREYRSDGTVWEWLDLTVTNGISYNSLIADLADDSKLNASVTLNAIAGSLLDIAALSKANNVGWSTVSYNEVLDLVNSYFDTTLIAHTQYFGNTLFSATDIELFIELFGDTYHEGWVDYDNRDVSRQIGSGSVSGGVGGAFNTPACVSCDQDNGGILIYDGQFYNSTNDAQDRIVYSSITLNQPNSAIGTWLKREVTPVPEPSTIVIFSLGLFGLAASCKKHSV